MSKKKNENKLMQLEKVVDGNTYKLYINGREMRESGHKHEGKIIFKPDHSFHLKKDLNFDASHLPDKVEFCIDYPEEIVDEEEESRVMLYIWRNADTITLTYFFSMDEWELLQMDINPIKLLKLFFDLAKKKKYKNSEFMEDGLVVVGGSLEVILPAKGNIYGLFKKHLEVFEKLMSKAGEQLGDKNQTLRRQRFD